MKKLFLTMLIALVSMSTMAQDHKWGAGLNLLYGTKINSIGFGVKGQYYATEAVRVEANAALFMKNDSFKKDDEKVGMKMWDANVVGHYLIPVASDKAFVYPLVGVGLTNWVQSAFKTSTRFTINAGAGFQFNVAEDFAINVEAKYQIVKDYGQGVFGIGAVYMF